MTDQPIENPEPAQPEPAPVQVPVTTTAYSFLNDLNPPVLYWDTPAKARHSVRVLCDRAGLTVYGKNIISRCINVESGYQNHYPDGNPVIHRNVVNGQLSSTDWGICQVNDYFHIGTSKDFPSVEYVMANPEKVVKWMILMYKEGHISQWVSYTSGAYLNVSA